MIVYNDKSQENLFIDFTTFNIERGNKRITWIEGINCTGKTTFAKNFKGRVLEASNISNHVGSHEPYIDRWVEILKIIKENPHEDFMIVRTPLSARAYKNKNYFDVDHLSSQFIPHKIILFEPSKNYSSLKEFYESVKRMTKRELDFEDLDLELNQEALESYRELIPNFVSKLN